MTMIAETGVATSRRSERALAALVAPLAIALAATFWACCHPYGGVIGDARLYLGHALASLDPVGLGRDLAFVYDGQSRYSLYPLIITPLVAALGASKAGILIACFASAAYFAATVVLARAFAGGRLAVAIFLTSTVLSTAYGDAGVFAFAETSAVPRPFAEAAVLLAVAAMLTGRVRIAVGCLILALLVHPIMAMAGVGVALVLVARHLLERARAGRVGPSVGSLAIAGIALAVAASLWLAQHLARVDEQWLAMMIDRSPHLFPTLWGQASITPLVAQLTTIVVAARLAGATERRLLVAVAISGLVQLAAAALLADKLHLLVALQGQFWRATWLLGAIGHCALVLAVARLWPRGPAARIVLAMLAVLWFFDVDLLVSLCAAGLALAVNFGAIGDETSRRLVVPVALVAGALILLQYGGLVVGSVGFLRALPTDAKPQTGDLLRNGLETLPVCLLTAVWLLRPVDALPALARVAALAGGTVLLASFATLTWDQRTPYQAFIETANVPDGFDRLSADRPREVLWLGALAEPWFMLGRPQYLSPQQAVGFVFSRPLAIEWWRRADALIGLGLAHDDIRYPWRLLADDDRIRATPAALAALCGRPDAPGVVVIPIRDDLPPQNLPGSLTWMPPSTTWTGERRRVTEWHRVLGWTAVPCAPRRS